MNGWKKMYHENMNQRVTGLDILILDKVDFKLRNVTGNKEGLFKRT